MAEDKIDSHWVTKESGAQDQLAEQGYRVTRREVRHGTKWVEMSKTIKESDGTKSGSSR